jgi:hypothetical protein
MEIKMHWLPMGVALLAALGIIAVGGAYLFNPWTATQGFGLPLPQREAGTTWWLRLKGVRDVVSGLLILALMTWSSAHVVGIALLVESLTPLGDMTLILRARGSARLAFGMHGLTAALMIAAAVALIIGRA